MHRSTSSSETKKRLEPFRKACGFLLGRTEANPSSAAARLSHDFLLLLSLPGDDPRAAEAKRRLDALLGDPTWGESATLFRKALGAVRGEIESTLKRDRVLRERLASLEAAIHAHVRDDGSETTDLIEAFWGFFCPQAAGIRANWEERIRGLRDRRTVRDLTPCPDPVERPAEQVLFTANMLLTIPPGNVQPEDLHLREDLRRAVTRALSEEQTCWYDHPVQIGAAPEQNEILHGLKGLSETLAYEKQRGNAHREDRLQVALSVSVTHPGLHGLSRTYIEEVVRKERGIRDLDLFVFTEQDTLRLVEDFLCPAARRFGLEGTEPAFFSGVFGVDGPYGRHYNFLKAVAALWQVVKAPDLRATFKIDLDQVFPEERLVRETGASAFEWLCTPLWGARGKDSRNQPVSLGLIAGALVNQGDIHKGLFTPDVTLTQDRWPPDRWVFASQVPQALSTAAEMMARYGDPELDGKSRCLSRVHVTGGTVGIRVDSLRRHRPFTLSSIGRAEDQAYLMSVLYSPEPPYLRYAHVPGLIMRHDKHAFAGQAIRTAAAGKVVGDYERMLLFSHYARALPWPTEETRACLDPFTGCFVLALPLSTALLSLALKTLCLDSGTPERDGIDPGELLRLSAHRLGFLVRKLEKDPQWMRESYETEQRAWHGYYEILDTLKREDRKASAEARRLIHTADSVIRETRVAT